ncbi:MAG: SWIM zinc finger domain-containing protein [Treponema sp.]|nr:SWIM zinc finger domain-containing protein [Treponema sp.]
MSITISEEFISHFTGNPSAIANGRTLANKGKFTKLSVSEDEQLLFGACQGSGKEAYRCSVDFIDAEKPIPRCTCPSRQIPCKHVVGLLYSYLAGKAFSTAPVPEDIAAKREKAADAVTSVKKAPTQVAKTPSASTVKKFHAQLDGIALAEKLLHNVVLGGLYALDDQNRAHYHDQLTELGNYYIPGVQAAFKELIDAAADEHHDKDFTETIGRLNYLHALLVKSRVHTEQKLVAYQPVKGSAPDAASVEAATAAVRDATLHSSIEEQMGYAWKLTELEAQGLLVKNAQLLQVGFESFEDNARSQWEERGVWLMLGEGGGAIYLTRHYIPYKAKQHIRHEDSFSTMVEADVYVYPGDRNPRIRWDGQTTRAVTDADLAAARNTGLRDYAAVIKAVKNQTRSALADKSPIFALHITRLSVNAEHGLSVFDEQGVRIVLRVDADFAWLLPRVTREQAEGSTLICRFNQDMKTGILWSEPLSLITSESVLRFTF